METTRHFQGGFPALIAKRQKWEGGGMIDLNLFKEVEKKDLLTFCKAAVTSSLYFPINCLYVTKKVQLCE